MTASSTRRAFGFLALLFAGSLAAAVPATAQERSDLETIRRSGTLRVGAALADPYYRRDISGNWSGLVPDFMEVVAKYMAVKIEYVETTWGTAAAGLQSNKFDVIGAFNVTPDRALAVDFTRSFSNLRFGLMTLGANYKSFKTWEEIEAEGIEILTVEGTGTHRIMTTIRPKIKWRGVANRDSFFLELESGRSTYGLIDELGANLYIAGRKKGAYIQPLPSYSSESNFAVRKSANAELLRWLDVTLGYMQGIGQSDAILAKYRPSQ